MVMQNGRISDARSVTSLKETLKSYCDGSGYKINMDKSSILFGPKCQVQFKQQVMQQIRVANEALQQKNLRMPTDIGRSPAGQFKSIVDRAWKLMNGWSSRLMSWAGKETLLKVVIQAILTFHMSFFRSPCDM